MSNRRKPKRHDLSLEHDAVHQAVAQLRSEGLTVQPWTDEPPASYTEPTMEWILGKMDDARVNAYHCAACDQVTITIDKHPGATPAFVSHGMFGAECDGETTSAWYRVRPDYALYATHEWYRPSRDELENLAGSPSPIGVRDDHTAAATVGHVMQGGLLLRRIPDTSDTVVDTLARISDRDMALAAIARNAREAEEFAHSARRAGKTRVLQAVADENEARMKRDTGGYRG
jgi:hypothetical protein